MRKLILALLVVSAMFGLLGCAQTTTKSNPQTIETDGTQDSIFNAISNALKDVFD